MNKQEYASLSEVGERMVGVADLADKTPRTLLYGYTCDRMTWHVYLDAAGIIHRVCYDDRRLLMWHTSGANGGITHNSDYVPNKRLYPESCDFEFCAALSRHQVSLPFTTFDDDAHAKRTADSVYAGRTAEQLTPTVAIGRDHLDRTVAVEDARVLLSQAASELGVMVESTHSGVCVDSRHIDQVIDRANQLSKSEDYQRYAGAYADPEGMAQQLLNELAPYQDPRAYSASIIGGMLTAQYSIETPLDFSRLATNGAVIEDISADARRVRTEDFEVVLRSTPGYREGTAQGFILQRLFGEPATFERKLRPYVTP